MSTDVTLACACGSFKAVVHNASPRTGNHAVCYCHDCQAFARHLEQSDRVLDTKGGTELYQTQPFQVEFLEGQAHLAVLQLAKKGLYRWYTTCCSTPLCNTMGSPKFSFVGFMAANISEGQDALGPVSTRYKPEQATAPVTEPKGSMARFAFFTIRNMIRARITGAWKQTPFFNCETGRSIVKPYVLSTAERERAYRT